MKRAFIAEYRKLVSTRLWWILLLCLAGYLGFIGALMAFSFVVAPEEAGVPFLDGRDVAASVYGLINAIGYVFPLVIGSLLITTEFRHGTITPSLLVEPRRSILLGGKLALAVPLGLVYGLVGTAALVGASAPLLAWQGDGAYLGDSSVLQVIALGVVTMALWTVIGVAFGSVLSNQVAGIVVLLAFTQFVEPIARVALGAFDGLDQVAKFLPGAAADGLIGASLLGELGGSGDLLSRPAALAVMLAYAVGLALIGRFTTLRRDIG